MRIQKRCIGYVAIVVDDYDKAIDYYTNKLGFTLVEDIPNQEKVKIFMVTVGIYIKTQFLNKY
ncbi:glyoxalase [Xenorhabdus indica]|nr:glyoxalase [Xenorhabdus indica]